MKTLRKILGLLIVLFIGIPILFAVIWAVGITRAAVSPEFVSDLPREIIKEVPSVVEEAFEEAKNEDLTTDENITTWFKAASEVDISPRELMKSMGLLDWLENELAGTFKEMGDILRGKRRTGPIKFDLRPLKEAFHSDAFKDYMIQVIDQLPPCDEQGMEQWSEMLERDYDLFEFPPCRPYVLVSEQVVQVHLEKLTQDIADEVEIFSNTRFVPLSLSRLIKLASYGLFLLPALIILLGSVIAATSSEGFFRWSGLSVLAGGLSSLLTALFIKQLAFAGIRFSPYSFSEDWSVEISEFVIEKTAWIQAAVVNHLFSPVIAVAGVVSIIGFVIFIISFIARGKPKPEKPKPAEEPDKKEEKREAEEEKKPVSEEKEEAQKKPEEKPEKESRGMELPEELPKGPEETEEKNNEEKKKE